MPMTGKKSPVVFQRAGARCEPAAANISSDPEETARSRTADGVIRLRADLFLAVNQGGNAGIYSRPF